MAHLADPIQGLCKELANLSLRDVLKTLCVQEAQDFNLFTLLQVDQEMQFSALLRFLLDPNEPHGLKNEFYNGFLGAINERFSKDKQLGGNAPEKLRLEYSFRTQEKESKSRRADIVVETDSWILVLENKISKSALRDFDQCADTFRQCVKDFSKSRAHAFVLLTPNDVDRSSIVKEQNNELYNGRFAHLTWNDVKNILFESSTAQSLDIKTTVLVQDFMAYIESNLCRAEVENG